MPVVRCKRCRGRGKVARWHSWTPRRSGMRWRYETTEPCETCYGSGVDLEHRVAGAVWAIGR